MLKYSPRVQPAMARQESARNMDRTFVGYGFFFGFEIVHDLT